MYKTSARRAHTWGWSMSSRFGFGRARIFVAVLPALLAVGCLSAFQRTLPVAMGNHTNSLATSEDGLRVSAPTTRSGLWNAVGRTLVQNYGHVVEEDAEAGAMISDFSYTTPQSSDSTVAVQERTRMAVVVPPGTTDASRIRVTLSSERRERRVGGEPSAWAPAGSSDAALRRSASDWRAASGARLSATRCHHKRRCNGGLPLFEAGDTRDHVRAPRHRHVRRSGHGQPPERLGSVASRRQRLRSRLLRKRLVAALRARDERRQGGQE